jgi:ketosteroid isomerase-like protein
MSPTTVKQSIQATNRLFETEVVGSRNFDALDSVYATDARILPPGAEMVSGRANIKEFWKNAVTTMNVTACRLETVDVEMLGDSAYEIGRATLTMQGGGTAEGKFVVVWKQEDGAWKWHVDIWNMNA